MYVFYDRRWKFIDEYMTIWEKVSNIIKKIIVNLHIIKNIWKLKKDSTEKKLCNVLKYK